MPANFAADRVSVDAWVRAGLIALAIWIIAPIVLFILGRILGQITLMLARNSRLGRNFFANSLTNIVQLLYRTVILIAVIYFYISIPLVFFAGVTLVGGSIYLGYLTPAHVKDLWQAKLILVVMMVFVIAAFIPILIAMFISESHSRAKRRRLTRDEAPLLWGVVEEVAQRVGTRPVNVISISTGKEIGVSEHGSWRQRLRKQTERELHLGFSALPGMTQAQFKAILAHEYGHFAHGDTAGGELAYKIRLAFAETMLALREQIADTGLIIWALFLTLIHTFVAYYDRFVFMRITIGARRLHEIQADRFAAVNYGSANFAQGLMQIVRQEVVFDAQFDHEEKAARKAKRRLHNLYTLPPLDSQAEEKIAPLIEKAMTRRISLDDTHPSPQERIHRMETLNLDSEIEANTASVWDLLANAESLQMEMTAIVQYILYTRLGHSWAK